jgi:hypothetical protein
MKNYIPNYEDFINEDILNDPDAKLWDTKYRINYDDLPANMDLRTPYLDKLLKGIPYQHYAFPQVSDDGNLIFKTQRDLDKAKKILSGLKESSITEGKDDYMAKSGNTDINLKKGYKHLVEYELDDLYTELGELSKKYKIKGITATFESTLNEGDMTKFYDGFIVLDSKSKKTYKFKYIKGTSNVNVENAAIDKLVKSTGLTRANFMVHGFVKKGEWNKDNTQVLESTLNEAAAKQFDKDVETLIKNIKRGYGWIEPEYVVDSWDNVSDTISFDLVKGEVLKRLFNAGLLYHSSDNGKDKGAKVTLSELGALALMKEANTPEIPKDNDPTKIYVLSGKVGYFKVKNNKWELIGLRKPDGVTDKDITIIKESSINEGKATDLKPGKQYTSDYGIVTFIKLNSDRKTMELHSKETGKIKTDVSNAYNMKLVESSVNEAQFFKATKDFEEFLEEIDGMPESRIKRIMGSKYIDTPGGFRDEADDYDNDIIEYMIANMGRKEFEKLQDYWETNIKESSTFIAESSMGDVHIMAEEAATFDEFKAEFVKEYSIGKKDNNKELHNWLQGIWKENHKK